MPASKVAKPKTSVVKRINKGVGTVSAARIQQVAKWISQGKSRATIIERLMEAYTINADTAADYYNDGVRFMTPEDDSVYKQELLKANSARLEAIYEKAMESGDFKNAREAIAELNKMAGITGNKVQIGYRTDNENNNTEFIIKLNDD